ncbi:MAG: hypothetical protein WC787_02235 [Patescibacteria group bacterium]|jgi:hypothetical protein
MNSIISSLFFLVFGALGLAIVCSGCAVHTSHDPVVATIAASKVVDSDLTYAPSSHGDYEVVHVLSKDAPATEVDTDLIATPARTKASRNTLFSCDKQGKNEVCRQGRLSLR